MVSNPSLIKLGSTPIEALIAMFKISICLLMFSFSIIKTKNFLLKILGLFIGCLILFY